MWAGTEAKVIKTNTDEFSGLLSAAENDVQKALVVLDELGGTFLTVASFVNHEIPTPAPDGNQVVFTVPDDYAPGSLKVFRDQSALLITVDFSETTSTTFTVVSAPDADEVLWVCYIKA